MSQDKLKSIQKYLMDHFDFYSMIVDLIKLPNIGVISRLNELRDYAAYAIDYVFSDKRNITISLTGSYLKATKKIAPGNKTIFLLESKLNKNSTVSISVKNDESHTERKDHKHE